MFNIDEYLDEIAIKELAPSDELIELTLSRCADIHIKKNNRQKDTQEKDALRKESFIKRTMRIAVQAAAVLMIGIVVGANIFASQQMAAPQAAAYYTVDINPSVCVWVDQNDIVTDIAGQNEDADILLETLNCTGAPATDAIGQIIMAAQNAGYLQDADKYVLVACFGKEESELTSLQTSLESDFGETVNLLIVSGTLEDKQMADTLKVSAGLLKLSSMAQGIDVKEADKVSDVVNAVNEVIQVNCVAPQISVAASGNAVKLAWSEIGFVTMGCTGKVTCKIVTGDTKGQITGMNADVLETITFYSYGTQTRTFTVSPSTSGIEPGEGKYYGIYTEYDGKATVVSNAVYCAMPG